MHTIELKNKHKLAYRDQGHGPVMVLVHGWGVSGALFESSAVALAENFRVIVPDLSGHGESADFADDASFASLADAMAELIRSLGFESICLLGWSLGAMVAWDLVQRYPDLNIAGLVTVDMVPCLLNDASWSHGLRNGSEVSAAERNIDFILSDWPAYINVIAPRWLSPADQTSPQLVEQVRQVMLRNDPRNMAHVWKQMEQQDLRAALSSIDIPTLVIAGGKSTLFDLEASEWVVQQISGARLEVFPDSGHAPHLDQPQRFNQLLAEFTSDLFNKSAGLHGDHKS